MKCPKCGFSQSDSNLECERCGVIFAKLGIAYPPPPEAVQRRSSDDESRQKAPLRDTNAPTKHVSTDYQENARLRSGRASHGVPSVEIGTGRSVSPESSRVAEMRDDVELVEQSSRLNYLDDDEKDLIPEPRSMDRDDWIVLGSGLVIAIVVMLFPLSNHIFMTLMTLIHEMGHAIVGWTFAYPSVPAFDLHYGGGITLHTQRSTVLLVVIYGFLAFLIFAYRKNVSTLLLLVVLSSVHLFLSLTYYHEVVILFMGHGTELIIAGIFFYRALSGAAVVHSVERPLYCAIGLFVVFSDIRFAFRLMTSHSARLKYEQAKGGGHWMDFSRIAEDFLGIDLTSVAFFFFLCCLLPLVLGFLTFRYQEYIRRGILRLWRRDPGHVAQ